MKLLALAMLVLVTAPATAQQRSLPPQPQPYYPQYGSYSRSLTVYNNVALAQEKAERDRIRRLREDLERTERHRTYIINRGGYNRRGNYVVVNNYGSYYRQ
jgi:hypothetical protein